MKVTSFFNEIGFSTGNHYILQIDAQVITQGCSVKKKTEKICIILWKVFLLESFFS